MKGYGTCRLAPPVPHPVPYLAPYLWKRRRFPYPVPYPSSQNPRKPTLFMRSFIQDKAPRPQPRVYQTLCFHRKVTIIAPSPIFYRDNDPPPNPMFS